MIRTMIALVLWGAAVVWLSACQSPAAAESSCKETPPDAKCYGILDLPHGTLTCRKIYYHFDGQVRLDDCDFRSPLLTSHLGSVDRAANVYDFPCPR